MTIQYVKFTITPITFLFTKQLPFLFVVANQEKSDRFVVSRDKVTSFKEWVDK